MPHWKHLKWLKQAFLLARLLVRLTIKQQGQTLTFCDLMTFSNVYTFMCWNSSVTTCIQTSHTKKRQNISVLAFPTILLTVLNTLAAHTKQLHSVSESL